MIQILYFYHTILMGVIRFVKFPKKKISKINLPYSNKNSILRKKTDKIFS